jgi:hypothetical protein
MKGGSKVKMRRFLIGKGLIHEIIVEPTRITSSAYDGNRFFTPRLSQGSLFL